MVKKKKLLIYAHYYAPDVASTGQIVQDLAEGVLEEYDVTVICTVPSYSGNIKDEYKRKIFYKESLKGVTIIRVPVPEFRKTSRISRVINILVYFINARKATHMLGYQDYVFAISQPPILGGMLGVYGKKKLRTAEGKHPKLIYNIQDFNPEQIDAIGYVKIKIIINIAMLLDIRSCREADLVVTVGRDLAETLENRFRDNKVPNYKVINNWVDDAAVHPLPMDNCGVISFKREYELTDKFVFMYSGNIGLYYDLEGLFRVIKTFKDARTYEGKEVVFVFVGEGALLDKLNAYKNLHNMNNVSFVPYQCKEKLVFSLNAADVHMCLSAKGIKGVSVPSKIYGILGVGKPVLGIVEDCSEAGMIIRESKSGVVSSPGDYESIRDNIRWFIENSNSEIIENMKRNGREYLELNLKKDTSIAKYRSSIGDC